jgi:hypothetical protein
MRKRIIVTDSSIEGVHHLEALALGAVPGDAEGLHNNAVYTIPTITKISPINYKALPLARIRIYAHAFQEFARNHPEMDFLLTAIGCTLAQYTPGQMADLFSDCPDNVYLQARLAYGL